MQDIEIKVLERIDANTTGLVTLTQQLIRIPSVNPPGNEGPVAHLASEELKKLGFASKLVEAERGRPNLIASLKGRKRKPRFCVYAHTDVVPPGNLEAWTTDPFGGAIVDGKIYGRGTSDHKFPISALVYAVKAIQRFLPSFDGELTFAFTADEEMGSDKGLKYVLQKRLLEADFGLYAGPSSCAGEKFTRGAGRDNVIIASEGFISYRLTVRGKVSHMMNLQSGVNAIYKASNVIKQLERLANRTNRRVHPLTDGPRMSVNIIHGGRGESVIPDVCEVILDRFYTPDEAPSDVTREVTKEIQKLKTKDPSLSLEMTERVMTPVAGIPKNSYLVKVIQDAGYRVRRRRPAPVGVASYTDMGWFQHYVHAPTALFGFGDLSLAHKPNEHIAIKDLVDSAKAYALIILKLMTDSRPDS